MKLSIIACAVALIGASLFTSCKKADSITGGGSGNLSAGKGMITFNSNINFGGNTSFNGNNSLYTSATRVNSGSIDQITIQATDISNIADTRTSQFIIHVAKGASTASGTLNGDFSSSSSASVWPVITISSASGDGYSSETGTVAITKLNDTEIEGNFSGKLVNTTKGTSITLSNGTFAGKFK